MATLKVTDEKFEEQVLKNEKLSLLDEFNEYAMSIQKKYENV